MGRDTRVRLDDDELYRILGSVKSLVIVYLIDSLFALESS